MPFFSGSAKWKLIIERKCFPSCATGNHYQRIHELFRSIFMYFKSWLVKNWATKCVENVAKVAHCS